MNRRMFPSPKRGTEGVRDQSQARLSYGLQEGGRPKVKCFISFRNRSLSLACHEHVEWSKGILILLASALLCGCGSTKRLPEVQVVSHTIHDTLYTTQMLYDSVYVYQNLQTDRSKDTVYIKDVQYQYKYKLLRDTTYVHRTDTIPVIKQVEVVKQVKYIPWYAKTFAWIGVICLLFLVIGIVIKIKP